MLPEGHKAVRLIISGRVQGVWFRGWTVDTAQELGLDGWVRNRADGTVEALLVGVEANVERMIGKCHEGPHLAHVTEVNVHNAMGITAKGFIQKPTVDVEARRT
ncbi:acylphosphatase [Paremcibacter congregatus]|uniref:Acylphosphatase n=1 Tax=Paremcibacter congregatus TaxID=2043170 RepID=A0A2G4YV98_9PROT|nr:acylphosphatase [Paremcibacter congregatus]PHZ86235.1 acylphosphatase [Paremcibacter congregatus]QDE27201.1 acylphosphatase [Paremcibacter congregatus]|tara:strand:+ start:534 stop:845 length:312 start_codon:yes stop_codon:yes gene_type:complete